MTNYLIDHKVPMGQAIDDADTILSASADFGISWKWYGALLGRENLYKATGTDGRGSFGFSQMQVMTAKIVAKELGDDPEAITPKWMEDHPLTMIRYGARHFHDLLREFNGPNQYYWATRAYNAGGTRIHLARGGSKRWKALSEKYYWDVDRRYTEISEYLEDVK